MTFLFEGNESTSLISAFDAEDIVLTLPMNLKVTELAWLSVWSGESGINFGELVFPEKIEIISESEEAPTSEPVVQKKSENSNGLESEASPSLKQTDADNDISSVQQHHPQENQDSDQNVKEEASTAKEAEMATEEIQSTSSSRFWKIELCIALITWLGWFTGWYYVIKYVKIVFFYVKNCITNA